SSTVYADECPRKAMRAPMDCAGDEFFAGPGFAGNQNTGVGRRDLRHIRKYSLQNRRSSHDLLEHGCLVDFFAKGNVFVLESLFSLFAIVDIGSRHIPSHNASLFISERVVAEKEPQILAVLSQQTSFGLVWGAA